MHYILYKYKGKGKLPRYS